jgi:hypothetical protein
VNSFLVIPGRADGASPESSNHRQWILDSGLAGFARDPE